MIFRNNGTPATLSEIFVWTTTDPYTSSDYVLWRWDGSRWIVVASGTGSTSGERVSFTGPAGDYVWRVFSFSGSGSYSFCLSRP